MSIDKSKKIKRWWMYQNYKTTMKVIIGSILIIAFSIIGHYLLWPTIVQNYHL